MVRYLFKFFFALAAFVFVVVCAALATQFVREVFFDARGGPPIRALLPTLVAGVAAAVAGWQMDYPPTTPTWIKAAFAQWRLAIVLYVPWALLAAAFVVSFNLIGYDSYRWQPQHWLQLAVVCLAPPTAVVAVLTLSRWASRSRTK